MSLKSVLACHNVSRNFKMADDVVHVLKDIDFEIHEGEMVSIVGASGSGKTTLLNLMAGLDDPTDGTVQMSNKPLAKLGDVQRASLRNKFMGFVFQFHHLLPEFSAIDNVLIPCRIQGKVSDASYQYARELLAGVGLDQRIDHRPAELSGGERQRVAIARALINKPGIVLMDEPTGNLDEETSEQIQKMIQKLNEQTGTCFVVVTHNQDWAQQFPVRYKLTKGHLVKA
ncbi:ABC transporter ATP-binding protein [Reinekea marinisedimentorum]|uniref:Lipoprotein-releasing system ATP-binding protein n=1 Tax=Reinekea marinisedimentorum TaxID=230495 RepID=A0A4R3I8V7_9GAMM|nr:ABC transporter ATP-binding protein [Reinekea marinisedimentorum]TCS42574.1 lipoprotein-releasing system ATP-binding protein [Reinekea marinisedimentorum]